MHLVSGSFGCALALQTEEHSLISRPLVVTIPGIVFPDRCGWNNIIDLFNVFGAIIKKPVTVGTSSIRRPDDDDTASRRQPEIQRARKRSVACCRLPVPCCPLPVAFIQLPVHRPVAQARWLSGTGKCGQVREAVSVSVYVSGDRHEQSLHVSQKIVFCAQECRYRHAFLPSHLQ